MSNLILDPQVDLTASIPYLKQNKVNEYHDRESIYSKDEWLELIKTTKTLYVGNLAVITSELQIHELFSRCGDIDRIIMGLDKIRKTPCGFCFIVYQEVDSAQQAANLLNHSILDNRPLVVNRDAGFVEGRQYGRGKDGGQLADERRRNRTGGDANNSFDSTGSSGGGQRRGTKRHMGDNARFMANSMTFLALFSLFFFLLVAIPYESHSHIILSSGPRNKLNNEAKGGKDFETTFARMLVNIMKSAKPSMMKAFMKATLEDPKLKEIAIGIFFNSNSNSTDSSD